jgi:hypothetical protein
MAFYPAACASASRSSAGTHDLAHLDEVSSTSVPRRCTHDALSSTAVSSPTESAHTALCAYSSRILGNPRALASS